jgi:hypothetical protein
MGSDIKRAHHVVSPLLYHYTKDHRLTFQGKHDGDVCVLFVSLSSLPIGRQAKIKGYIEIKNKFHAILQI